MKKLAANTIAAVVTLLALPVMASAHVLVTPRQAQAGDDIQFTIGVPNEKQVPVQSIRLTIPHGLQQVQPDVAAGWDITTDVQGNNVTAITWTGTIPAGQRADLSFRAQTPAQAGELDWKAYQTYADGTTVSWDQKPVADASDDDSAGAGPYSVTKVTNDLGTANTTISDSSTPTLALAFSVAALVLSISSLFIRLGRRKA